MTSPEASRAAICLQTYSKDHDFHDRGQSRAVCAHCGQVREIFSDGRVNLIKMEGTINYDGKIN